MKLGDLRSLLREYPAPKSFLGLGGDARFSHLQAFLKTKAALSNEMEVSYASFLAYLVGKRINPESLFNDAYFASDKPRVFIFKLFKMEDAPVNVLAGDQLARVRAAFSAPASVESAPGQAAAVASGGAGTVEVESSVAAAPAPAPVSEAEPEQDQAQVAAVASGATAIVDESSVASAPAPAFEAEPARASASEAVAVAVSEAAPAPAPLSISPSDSNLANRGAVTPGHGGGRGSASPLNGGEVLIDESLFVTPKSAASPPGFAAAALMGSDEAAAVMAVPAATPVAEPASASTPEAESASASTPEATPEAESANVSTPEAEPASTSTFVVEPVSASTPEVTSKTTPETTSETRSEVAPAPAFNSESTLRSLSHNLVVAKEVLSAPADGGAGSPLVPSPRFFASRQSVPAAILYIDCRAALERLGIAAQLRQLDALNVMGRPPVFAEVQLHKLYAVIQQHDLKAKDLDSIGPVQLASLMGSPSLMKLAAVRYQTGFLEKYKNEATLKVLRFERSPLIFAARSGSVDAMKLVADYWAKLGERGFALPDLSLVLKITLRNASPEAASYVFSKASAEHKIVLDSETVDLAILSGSPELYSMAYSWPGVVPSKALFIKAISEKDLVMTQKISEWFQRDAASIRSVVNDVLSSALSTRDPVIINCIISWISALPRASCPAGTLSRLIIEQVSVSEAALLERLLALDEGLKTETAAIKCLFNAVSSKNREKMALMKSRVEALGFDPKKGIGHEHGGYLDYASSINALHLAASLGDENLMDEVKAWGIVPDLQVLIFALRSANRAAVIKAMDYGVFVAADASYDESGKRRLYDSMAYSTAPAKALCASLLDGSLGREKRSLDSAQTLAQEWVEIRRLRIAASAASAEAAPAPALEELAGLGPRS